MALFSADVASRLYVDGELRPSAEGTYPVVSPATGEIIGHAAEAGTAETEAAIAAARRAFDTTDWSRDTALRTRCLRALHTKIRERIEEFRTRWTGHVVDHYRSGDQHFHHEVVGDLTLRYEALDVVADPGLTLLVYHAEPGSLSAAALARLAP